MSDETKDPGVNLSSALALRDALISTMLLGFQTDVWSSGSSRAYAKAAFVGTIESNDNLANATVLTQSAYSSGSQFSGGDSTQTGENLASGTIIKTSWYKFTATANGPVTFTNTGSSGDEPTLQVFTGPASNPTTSNLSAPIATNEQTTPNGTATLTFNAVSGTTYYIQQGTVSGTANPGSVNYTLTETVCYASGTLIRTMRGDAIADVPVEHLAVGDLVVTSSGAHRPIKWLGHRKTGCRNHPRPHEVMPIRIAAHAFGTNKPARDLWVSPGHAICVNVVEEVLIPAAALVNGTTIQQVEVDAVTYWHVELDSHDIILAENLPAESYLDMSNRGFFAEADIVDLDASSDASLAARTHADFCRPYHGEGPLVDVVRAQLRVRATATLGWTLDHEPMADLHLIADGRRIDPAVRDLTARFIVPAGARDVWLVSHAARPCDISDSVDVRDLGLRLTSVAIDDGFKAARQISLSDPLLCAGFHDLEEGQWRWTDGRAHLPSALWDDCPEGVFLRIELAAQPLPRWVAPDVDRQVVSIAA